jgi:diguanylate cyclase (GGDEF)-like protein
MIADANEQFYSYIGKRSALPFDNLIHPDDTLEFFEEMNRVGQKGEAHFLIRMSNLEEEYRIVYIDAQISQKVEDGEKLRLLRIYDIVDMAAGYMKYRSNISKYRRFLMLSNLYLFEYSVETEIFKIYKCMNDKSIMLVEQNLDSWCNSIIQKEGISANIANGINTLRETLQKGTLSFELQLGEKEDGNASCTIRGLPFRRQSMEHLSVGIIIADNAETGEAYYVTPSARDSATGLMNKKAMMEYIISRLHRKKDQAKWLIVLDIDNFKGVNDRYGHLFGDQVIQMVADTISEIFAIKGVCGRFGGDEFVIFVEQECSEEDLRSRLKTIAKHLAVAFADDPVHNIKVTLSIGITCYPKDGQDYQELFSKADKSLYIAKDKGKSRYIIYDEKLHGNYEIAKKAVKNVEYAMAGEKRTAMLCKIVTNLAIHGASALASPQVQQNILDVFDVDGMTVFTNGCKKRFCVCGEYAGNPDEDIPGYIDTGYYSYYDSNHIYVDCALQSMMVRNEKAYSYMKNMEVGSCMHCLTMKNDRPDVLVTFDIFNRIRKWSDTETEELAMLGKLIGAVLSVDAT